MRALGADRGPCEIAPFLTEEVTESAVHVYLLQC